ncbi:hypothetical protein BC826DRAFT_1110230 [Russula brevipes]|nr:hypothetical protein BC826DRAFT_1110230 [Russula brevipes]
MIACVAFAFRCLLGTWSLDNTLNHHSNATGLVTLWFEFEKIHHFRPNDLLQLLSLTPQLETLGTPFQSPGPNRDVESQLLRVSAYLEALLPRMTAALLEKLEIVFLHQLTFAVPRLQQFMGTTGNLRTRPRGGGYTMYTGTA